MYITKKCNRKYNRNLLEMYYPSVTGDVRRVINASLHMEIH